MASQNVPTPTITACLGAYLGCLVRHSWDILLLRHGGDGLRSLPLTHRCALMTLALAVGVGMHYGHPSGTAQGALIYGLLASGCAVSLDSIDRYLVAGYAAVLMTTEPVSWALRYLPFGQAVNVVFSLWCMTAVFVFVLRAVQAKLNSTR